MDARVVGCVVCVPKSLLLVASVPAVDDSLGSNDVGGIAAACPEDAAVGVKLDGTLIVNLDAAVDSDAAIDLDATARCFLF